MLKTIMDVGPLVVDLKQLLCSVQKPVMGLHERLAISQLLWVFDDFVKDWLILNERFSALVVVLPFHHVFNGLPLVGKLLIFICLSVSTLVDLLLE
jgi:hypothetical protein